MLSYRSGVVAGELEDGGVAGDPQSHQGLLRLLGVELVQSNEGAGDVGKLGEQQDVLLSLFQATDLTRERAAVVRA